MNSHLRSRLFRLTFGLLVACLGSTTSWSAELRLAVSRGPVSLPLYVAQAKGFFADEGLVASLIECHSGRECFQLAEAGTADLATSAELIVTLDSLKSSTAAIVATVSTSTQQIKLVARRSAGIGSPSDMPGKRIGTVPRTSALYFLENWLLYFDIDARQVQIVQMPVNRLVEELAGRRIDAIAIWEPVASEAVARLGADHAPLVVPRVYSQHFVLSINKGRLAERRADVLRLLRGLARAERLIAARPEEAAEILAARLQLDHTSARAVMSEHDYRLGLTPTLLSTMDSQARWAIRERIAETTSGPEAVLRAIDPGPLRSVAPDSVSLPNR